MPYLFCETHGQEQEAESIAQQDEYRELGETVLIVSGRLISGPWQCDRCQAPLGKGRTAHLHVSFSRSFAGMLGDYDYRYEAGYFDMGTARVAVYGARPPGGMPTPEPIEEEL